MARRRMSAAVAAGCARTVESLTAAALGPAGAVMALLVTAAAAGGAAADGRAQQLLFLQEKPALAAATAVGSPFVAIGICLGG